MEEHKFWLGQNTMGTRLAFPPINCEYCFSSYGVVAALDMGPSVTRHICKQTSPKKYTNKKKELDSESELYYKAAVIPDHACAVLTPPPFLAVSDEARARQ